MKIISLGSNCYVQNLIDKTKYNGPHNIFDWMNIFSFSKLCDLLDDGFLCLFNSCNNIVKNVFQLFFFAQFERWG